MIIGTSRLSFPATVVRAFCCSLLLWIISTTAAHATVATILCRIYDDVLIGGLAPGIATMAVIALGISATLGKVSWGMAIMVAIGIMVLFGASAVVGYFGASGCP